jgi:antibiotic biosynthesis monooxygenase (ABM) superfamily enzyme
MVVTVLRSRLKRENEQEYFEWAARMAALAKSMPGYVSHKVFTAQDAGRVTLVEFEDEEGRRAR